MLVLSRRAGERIQIGDQIEVTVVRIGPGVIRIGIDAPSEMTVVREQIRQSLLVTDRQRKTGQTESASDKIAAH